MGDIIGGRRIAALLGGPSEVQRALDHFRTGGIESVVLEGGGVVGPDAERLVDHVLPSRSARIHRAVGSLVARGGKVPYSVAAWLAVDRAPGFAVVLDPIGFHDPGPWSWMETWSESNVIRPRLIVLHRDRRRKLESPANQSGAD